MSALAPLAAADSAALAALHARCFPAAAPPPWSADALRAAITAPGAIALGSVDGFVIGRAAAGEAELLTLAVAPALRRRGLGADLASGFAAAAAALGADAAFLEVAEANAAARALYARAGWTQVGRRPRYYGPGADALILRLALSGPQDFG